MVSSAASRARLSSAPNATSASVTSAIVQRVYELRTGRTTLAWSGPVRTGPWKGGATVVLLVAGTQCPKQHFKPQPVATQKSGGRHSLQARPTAVETEPTSAVHAPWVRKPAKPSEGCHKHWRLPSLAEAASSQLTRSAPSARIVVSSACGEELAVSGELPRSGSKERGDLWPAQVPTSRRHAAGQPRDSSAQILVVGSPARLSALAVDPAPLAPNGKEARVLYRTTERV